MSLLLTVQLMLVAVAIATVVGIVGAWAAAAASNSSAGISRLSSRLFFVAMVVCIATPLILHAAAWEATAGKFGWMPLTQAGASGYGGLGGVFGGLVACGWIHGLFGSSLVALATWYGSARVPETVIQQSRLERGPLATWWKVQLPLAMPWVTTAMLATAAIAATEMTVVDLYGYRTLADRFYLQYIVDPTVGAIARTIAIPLVMAGLIMFVFISRCSDGSAIESSLPSSQSPSRSPEKLSKIFVVLATMLTLLIAGLVVIIPLSGIVIKAGHEVIVEGTERSVSWSASRFSENVLGAPRTFAAEYRWTIVLAALTGIIAVVLGWTLASIGRTHRRFRSVCDCLSILLVLIPGPIVGLTIVRFFQIDLPGFRTLYHQSLVPTMIGLLVRAVPVTYWMVRVGYRGIDDRVLRSASMDGTWIKRMWSIDRPLLKRSLASSFIAAAVVASGDVPVMLPVMPPGVTTVGTRLFEQLHSGARYQEASLAIWYVAGIAILAIVSCRWNTKSRARMDA